MQPNPTQSLYEQDFSAWLEKTAQQLRAGDYQNLDHNNLIEEIESLGKREKRELESRLTTLFEHALKRQYLDLPECYRGWDSTIRRTQKEIIKVLRDSPSLKVFLRDIYLDCYQDALENMRLEYSANFPENYPFETDTTKLLESSFVESDG
ncbi:DUF29 domain-containing protein [[Limnothrix rosea] IAM M-220]|uniref:DUF29 domain-containing protein n=1 Tax=[Limnothrix rosea] IAM M-220 TaxID=454133 RepID=UPI00095F57D1|nr:DUF29 domain-containing protein [[Limnothrix rosea] IAM M-220]OKH13777.1 hypothetical protein NIES208_14710 [[Limnothrix rosea] IAM M-220]